MYKCTNEKILYRYSALKKMVPLKRRTKKFYNNFTGNAFIRMLIIFNEKLLIGLYKHHAKSILVHTIFPKFVLKVIFFRIWSLKNSNTVLYVDRSVFKAWVWNMNINLSRIKKEWEYCCILSWETSVALSKHIDKSHIFFFVSFIRVFKKFHIYNALSCLF